jgi:hypothetical protein
VQREEPKELQKKQLSGEERYPASYKPMDDEKEFFRSGFIGLALVLFAGILLYFLFSLIVTSIMPEMIDSVWFRTVSVLINFLLVFFTLPFVVGFLGVTLLLKQLSLESISLVPGIIGGAILAFVQYGLILSTANKTLNHTGSKKFFFIALVIAAYIIELILFAGLILS